MIRLAHWSNIPGCIVCCPTQPGTKFEVIRRCVSAAVVTINFEVLIYICYKVDTALPVASQAGKGGPALDRRMAAFVRLLDSRRRFAGSNAVLRFCCKLHVHMGNRLGCTYRPLLCRCMLLMIPAVPCKWRCSQATINRQTAHKIITYYQRQY